MRKWLGGCIIAALIAGGLALGLAAGILIEREILSASKPPAAATPAAAPNWDLVTEAWELIDRTYVDREALQPITLTYGAISGMVDSLGDTGHSRFLSPEMLKAEQEYNLGQYEGVGLQVESSDGQTVVVAPLDGSPAQKAGIRAGEIILRVDGEDISGMPIDQVVGRILGPAGTKVTLSILNPDTNQVRDVPLTRQRIALVNVSWARVPGTNVAHLRLAAFSQGVTKDLQAALRAIQSQQLTGLVLDLRNNPGGILDEAVGTASQFLTGGDVVLVKDANGEISRLRVQRGGVATGIPMAVLVNGGTASASEIVAGALQDAARATLIGETTIGTGTVLQQFNLSDGSAMLLAIQEWLTPKGNAIWHQGLAPDVEVSLEPGTFMLLPRELESMSAEDFRASADTQLLRAVEVVRERALSTETSTD